MPTITAVVEDIVFRNETNGFTVASIKPSGQKKTTAVGVMPFLAVGECAVFEGEIVEHKDYGEQIKVDSYEVVMPEKKSEIEHYLASGIVKGVGPATAKLIVKRFGKDTLDIMEANPERLAEVPGIGARRARSIGESFAVNIGMRRTMMFLQGLGITPNLASKVCTKFGDMTEIVVRNNPYRLADEVEGVGFRTADRIALALGFTMESRVRLLSGIQYVLNEAMLGGGHVYLPYARLMQEAMRILDADEDPVYNALAELIVNKQVVTEERGGETAVYLPRLFEAERDTARLAKRLIAGAAKGKLSPQRAQELIAHYEEATEVTLASGQREAVLAAAFNGVTVITGGPGTGKTTSLRCLILLLEQMGKIELCAPTGRAAKRLSETTGCPARTIHRMLEYTGDEEGFGRDEDNPIDADSVIVDETSMVDIFLMRALLRAIKPGARVVLVGDADQLPSVGAGNVLRDFIDSDAIPVVKLTEIFRQAAQSSIILNAHRINRGEYPVIQNRETDFFLERKQSPGEAAQAVVALVKSRLPAYLGIDGVRDIQVMAPMKKGDAGVHALNRLMQESLNPPAPGRRELRRGDALFRAGDKVMQIKNDYELEWTRGDEDGKGVFNGDIGYVLDAHFEDSALTVEFDDGRICKYEDGKLDALELAYCVSVHKSQGSEFEAVVLPLISGPPMLMTRNLLYTAVTRARRLVCVVGREECMRRMVDNNHIDKRFSALEARLREIQ
ncbi:MAG: ATP-dependent RecD-like DNA helicase [Christensenellales bacterium]|jgi:exodeoxyribonuclease V alpha subunit